MGAKNPIGYCTLHFYGGDVQVDLCDLQVLDPFNTKWTIIKKGKTKYATAKIIVDGEVKNVYMHRLILGSPDGVVDHVDRNGLHNRRMNLRVVSAHANWVNSAAHLRGKSKYKGVSAVKKTGRWRAALQANRKWEQIGTFDTEEEAARAYDARAAVAFGPTAYLNREHFPL